MTSTLGTTRPPLVLIANDQEWSARSLETILGPNGYAVLRAYTGRQAFDLARSSQPDAVILDLRLPDIDGVEVCRMLRDDPRFGANTPILVTTADAGERAQASEAYRAGAWDFCVEPINGEVMLLKLDTFVKAKREADRVRDESLLDQMTGLYNMRGLARRAREIGAEAYRHRNSLACVAFAPEAGGENEAAFEELAARVAEHLGGIIRREGRISDAIGRLGQSEFAIIAPATEVEGVLKMIDRLQKSIENSPMSVDGEQRTLKIRAGYCAVPDYAESSVDAVEMLLRAATALRQVRNEVGGGDRPIRAFDESSLRYIQ